MKKDSKRNFTDLPYINNIKGYSCCTSFEAVFADRLNRTILKFLKKPVFQSGDVGWNDVLPTITKQYYKKIHSSTNLKPIQASFEKNKGFVYKNFLDRRKKNKPKCKIDDLVRSADIKITISKKKIQLIGHLHCMKLLKLILIQYRVTE